MPPEAPVATSYATPRNGSCDPTYKQSVPTVVKFSVAFAVLSAACVR
jgi:hypothetical protein